MKTQITEGLLNVTITEKKGHSEYCETNTPTKGLGKDNLDNLSLDNINLAENDPVLLEQRENAEREKQISINEEGNEVDGNGKVLRTKEQITESSNNETPADKEARLEQERLAQEQNQIILDKDGNQVDKDGKILKTKEVLAQEEIDRVALENIPLIEELITTAGVKILNEDGTPKVYEDTTEGIIQYANDLAELKLIQSQKELFKAYPNVEKYLQAQIKGIPDSEFFGNKLTDWKGTTLDEANEAQQLDIVIKELESKGYDKDRVIKMANRIKDSGKDVLLEESKLSLQSLKETQIAVETTKQEKYQEYIAQETAKAEAHWNKVGEIITGGKIGNYIIPEVDRKAFNDYVALAVDNNGNSAAMIARNKQTLEQKLLADYYNFKGMSFEGLAKIAVQTATVKTLRDRIPKKDNNSTASKVTDGKTTINFNDIKLENVTKE